MFEYSPLIKSFFKGKCVSQLVQLRQKIQSIQTTRKITHAVRLVSMSLYAKLEKQAGPLSTYLHHIQKLFVELVAHSPEWKNPISWGSWWKVFFISSAEERPYYKGRNQSFKQTPVGIRRADGPRQGGPQRQVR